MKKEMYISILYFYFDHFTNFFKKLIYFFAFLIYFILYDQEYDFSSPLNRSAGWLMVSLFNGISTFVGYLMPKPFTKKNSCGTI